MGKSVNVLFFLIHGVHCITTNVISLIHLFNLIFLLNAVAGLAIHIESYSEEPIKHTRISFRFEISNLNLKFISVPPSEHLGGLSDVIKFQLNTSGVSADDVISARLGVYVRRPWRVASTPRRREGTFTLTRVQVRDVAGLRGVHALIRRNVYRVSHRGHWLMFEASSRISIN